MSGDVVLVELREGKMVLLVDEAHMPGEVMQLLEGKMVLLVEEAHMPVWRRPLCMLRRRSSLRKPSMCLRGLNCSTSKFS